MKRCVRGHEKAYILERVTNQAERHAKFGGSVFMQEPNTKNGCGSLRDYQNLLWVAFFKEGVPSTAGLVQKKLLTEAERRQLDRAYDFLLRVRTELHYLNKRGTDVLSLVFQGQIANSFNYPQKNILRRTEAFMREYYQHARNIFHLTELLAERLCLSELEAKRSGLLGLLPSRRKPVEHFDGFHSRGRPDLRGQPRRFQPGPLPRSCASSSTRSSGTCGSRPELQQLVRRRLQLVDRTFQYSRAARETFSAILSRKGEVGRTLRMMHTVDFLGRYIPEFGELTCLVQHEFFHRYTADEHTLVCIEKLDSLIDTSDAEAARLPHALPQAGRPLRALPRAHPARYRQGHRRAPPRRGQRALRAESRLAGSSSPRSGANRSSCWWITT